MTVPDIEVRMLESLGDLHACVRLQKETWGEECTEVVPVSVLRTIPRLGGVVAGAFEGERLVGLVVGFGGFDVEGAPIHWSDMLAVREELRDRGLGERLKRFQRDALLRRGVRHVYWTFDPIESRNAYLNFARLGVVASEYLPDYYGETDSPLHRGLPTDRLVADWAIASERVRRRLAGDRAESFDWRALPAAVVADTAGTWPEPSSVEPCAGSDAVRIAIPANAQALRRAAPELAGRWQAAARAAFLALLGQGYVVVEVVRDGSVSHYVLRRGVELG